jgi:hypothetical protein
MNIRTFALTAALQGVTRLVVPQSPPAPLEIEGH